MGYRFADGEGSVIGGMDFLNPMFIMNEAFAGSFGLHDRRPKNGTTAGGAPAEPGQHRVRRACRAQLNCGRSAAHRKPVWLGSDRPATHRRHGRRSLRSFRDRAFLGFG